jgi:hypothetical protein
MGDGVETDTFGNALMVAVIPILVDEEQPVVRFLAAA